jgi:hypothetical protein
VLGRRIVERFEPVRDVTRAGLVGQLDALRFANDGEERLLAGAGEEKVQTHAEHERNSFASSGGPEASGWRRSRDLLDAEGST